MAPDIKYIWLDGQLVEYAKATIPFMSSTVQYGIGAFEGIRCYDTDRGPAVFRLREHMVRLFDSAHILGFKGLPHTLDELIQATKDTIKANGLTSCYIRPLVYHDNQSGSLNLDHGPAKVGIAAWYWGAYLGEDALEKGVRANISSFTRHHPNVMLTKAKVSGNYVNSLLAKTESVRLGFEEAIMLDPQGYVAECTGENLFIVRHGKIYTTQTHTILEGITRDSVFALAADEGYEVIEQPISRDQLYIADEVFVCGTAAEVIGVREIDFRVIGNGSRGPVTHKLQQAFHAAITGKHPRSAGWLDYVNA